MVGSWSSILKMNSVDNLFSNLGTTTEVIIFFSVTNLMNKRAIASPKFLMSLTLELTNF